jgi:poly(3-hydroxybutyrate) depolymerase
VRLKVVAAVVVAAAALSATAAEAARTAQPPLSRIAASCVESDFASGTHEVRARLCLPDGASATRRVPGVIVLHGCGGRAEEYGRGGTRSP